MKKIAFLFLLVSSCALRANDDGVQSEEMKKLLGHYAWFPLIQSGDLVALKNNYRSPADLQRRIKEDVNRDGAVSNVSARLIDAGDAVASSVPFLWVAEERKAGVTFQGRSSGVSRKQKEQAQLIAINALPKKSAGLDVGPFAQSKL